MDLQFLKIKNFFSKLALVLIMLKLFSCVHDPGSHLNIVEIAFSCARDRLSHLNFAGIVFSCARDLLVKSYSIVYFRQNIDVDPFSYIRIDL